MPQRWLVAWMAALAACQSTSPDTISSDKLEEQIEAFLAAKEVEVEASCGPRSRPSTPGSTFSCALAQGGKEVATAEVTVKDTRGNVDWKLVGGLISSDQLEKEIAAKLAEAGTAANVDCGPRHHLKVPNRTFDCKAKTPEGEAGIVVTVGPDGSVTYKLKAGS